MKWHTSKVFLILAIYLFMYVYTGKKFEQLFPGHLRILVVTLDVNLSLSRAIGASCTQQFSDILLMCIIWTGSHTLSIGL